MTEFVQKHRPYPGQHFAAIQIYQWMKPTRARFAGVGYCETTIFLILESVPMDAAGIQRYRRVAELSIGKGNGLALPLDRTGVMTWRGEPVYVHEIPDMLGEKPWGEQEVILI